MAGTGNGDGGNTGATMFDISVPITGGAAAPSGSDISGGVKFGMVNISNNSFLMPALIGLAVFGGILLWKKFKR